MYGGKLVFAQLMGHLPVPLTISWTRLLPYWT